MTRTDLRASARTSLVCAVAAVAFYCLFIARTSFRGAGGRVFVLFEDAMISMRYARNFAAGDGLVWNAGEAHVEGYTNFLWTVLMSVPFRLGIGDAHASLFVMALGGVLLLACGALAARLTATLSDAPWAPAAAGLATLFCYPLVFWTLRGMEVGALAALVLALAVVVTRLEAAPRAGTIALAAGLAALAVLLRSDAVVALTVVGLYGAATTTKGARWAFVLAFGGAIGAALAGHAAFRLAAYGDVVPNTYYLKLYGVPLAARLARGLFVSLRVVGLELAVPLAVIAAGAPIFVRRATTARVRRAAFLATLVLAQLAYGTYVGGDAWEWMLYANRYLTVALPFVVVLSVVAAAALFEGADDAARQRGAATIFVAGLVLLGLEMVARRYPEVGIARTIVGSKTVFAAGALYAFAGAALSTPWALTAAPRLRLVPSAVVIALAVWLPAHAPALLAWVSHNAAQYNDEERYARLGLALRDAAPKDTRLAVVAAGATPFFAHLPAEDLLGKNDAVIAKKRPVGVFSPGHDKWDYRYSLGQKRPAIVVELADATSADERYVEALGYERLASGLRVLRDATGVDREALARLEVLP